MMSIEEKKRICNEFYGYCLRKMRENERCCCCCWVEVKY